MAGNETQRPKDPTQPDSKLHRLLDGNILYRLVKREKGTVVTFRIIWRKSLHAMKHGGGMASRRMVSDNPATPANHDARAALTCVESKASGRVHRLDRCSGFDTGQSTHSRSLAFDLSLRSRLAGIKALFSQDRFKVADMRQARCCGAALLRRFSVYQSVFLLTCAEWATAHYSANFVFI